MGVSSNILRAIIMGAPGAGKGTIATRIVKDFGMKHLSSGDVLRKQITEKTDAGVLAKSFIDKGQLVPDDVIVRLITHDMSTMGKVSWLLDGFPRTVSQAESLVRAQDIDVVINLKVPFEVIMDRILGRWTHQPSGRIYHTSFNPPKVHGIDDETGEALVQRQDDKEETVKARLEHYKNLTQPVLKFFGNKGIVQEFAGDSSNVLWPQIHEALSKKIKPQQYTKY